MRLRQLSQLYYLNREIEIDQERLEELRAKAENPPTSALTGMPVNHTNESRVERCVIEMVDLAAIIKAKQEQCIHERNRLESFIGGIEDSLTRLIFTLRCVNGFNWFDIAEHIGGGNTDEGVKQRFYRELRRIK